MGNPLFSLPSLERILESDHKIKAIISNPLFITSARTVVESRPPLSSTIAFFITYFNYLIGNIDNKYLLESI